MTSSWPSTATLRKFRPRRQVLGASPDVFASAIGYANFVRMVAPAKGAELLARAKELAAKHGWQPRSAAAEAARWTHCWRRSVEAPTAAAGAQARIPPSRGRRSRGRRSGGRCSDATQDAVTIRSRIFPASTTGSGDLLAYLAIFTRSESARVGPPISDD